MSLKPLFSKSLKCLPDPLPGDCGRSAAGRTWAEGSSLWSGQNWTGIGEAGGQRPGVPLLEMPSSRDGCSHTFSLSLNAAFSERCW